MKSFFELLAQNKRHLATAAFVVGFFVDAFTFGNLNLNITLILLSAYLVVASGTLLLSRVPPREAGKTPPFLKSLIPWLPVVHQYAIGALLSPFLVLYYASGSFSASWPFLAVVALAAVGNETVRLERHRLPFQTTLLFLNLILFAALAAPIFMRETGIVSFMIALGGAAGVFFLFVLIGSLVAPRDFAASARLIRAGAAALVGMMLLLYITHLIPPIPLSAKAAGFYHSVQKIGDTYVVTDEIRPWYERFLDVDGIRLRLAPGEAAYFYGSVFAPARLTTDIVHRWQEFDEKTGEWVTRSTVRFDIIGGRPEGYRGHSLIQNPAPGRWRVSVETAEGAVIARASLRVERVPEPVEKTRITLE